MILAANLLLNTLCVLVLLSALHVLPALWRDLMGGQ